MPSDIHGRIEYERGTYSPDAASIEDFRNYVRGIQYSPLTQEQIDALVGLTAHEFRDNICHQIVGQASDRIDLQHWNCGNSKVKEYLDILFAVSQLATFQADVHYNALRDGNHLVGLDWDASRGSVRLSQQPWWDGFSGSFMGYDGSGRPEYVVKEWVELPEGKRRRVVWYDTFMERWQLSSEGKWESIQLPTDAGEWPIEWIKADGGPLRLPFVHFYNADRKNGNYGLSELSGGFLGLQDQLNDLQYDLSAGVRLTAFQMITGTGVEEEIDPETNEPREVRFGPASYLHSANQNARFGYIPAGDLGQMVNVYKLKLQRGAQITRTPYHIIAGGEWPSGEALMRAEQPSIGKARIQLKAFNASWTYVAHKAVELFNKFSGQDQLPEDPKTALITAEFVDPERRDLLSLSTVVHQLLDVISPQEAMRLLNWDEQRIEKVIKERREDPIANSGAPRPKPVLPPGATNQDVSPSNRGSSSG